MITAGPSLTEQVTRSARYPDFVMIGAARCGSTTLYEHLQRHPEVTFSRKKEPNFFNNHWSAGLAWYGDLFRHAEPNQRVGDASVMYSAPAVAKQVIPRIAEVLPEVKLLLLMRHPVDRAYSDFLEQVKTARIEGWSEALPRTFEEFIELRPEVIATGRYIETLDLLEKYFPASAVLPLRSSDLFKKTEATLAEVCAFLGISAKIGAAQGPIAANRSADGQYWHVRNRVLSPLRGIRLIRWVAQWIPEPGRDLAYRIMSGTKHGRRVQKLHYIPPMQSKTRKRLLAAYEPANQQLAARLGWDLSGWAT